MSITNIDVLNFRADTSGLLASDAALNQIAQRCATAEAALSRFAATAATAMAKVPAAMSGLGGSGGSGSGWGSSGWTASISGGASAFIALGKSADEAGGAIKRQKIAIDDSERSHRSHSGAVYANRLQMMELMHIGRALFDEMAAGGNVFRALAMEGGRLQVALSTGEGGLGGLVTRLGTGFSAMLNPIALATGGVAAFGIASAAAFASYENGQARLANSLNGIGRRSGATVGQLNQIAAAGAASGGLSNSQAIGLAAQYTGAGLAPGISQSLMGVTRDYARVSDQSVGDAGGALAKAVADPIRGLGELDKQFGVVDDRLMQTATNLERSGHIEEAQSLAADAWRKAIESATDNTWGFSKAIDGAENFLSNAFSGAGHGIAAMLGMNSDAEKLATLRSTAANLQKVDPVSFADEIAELKRQMEPLIKSVQDSEAAAATRKKDADDTALSREAGSAIRQLLPDFARAQSAANTIEVLRQAIASPGIQEHLGLGEAGRLNQAFGNAVVMQSMNQPGVQQSQDYQLRLASADAFSVGEKAIVEARRAELEVLRQTGDVARAATAAQMSMNEAIAKGNSDAEDRLQLSRQNASLVGLSPYERGLQEIRNKYEGYGGIFDKDATTGTNVSKIPDIENDLAAAAHKVQMALDDNAPRIDAAGSKIVAALEGVANRLSPAGQGWGALIPGSAATLASGGFSGPGTATASMIADASARTGIPAPIIAAVGKIENGGRLTGGTTMLGSDGRPSSAWGYGQLTNGAARDVANVLPGFDKYNPATAVLGSAEYLRIQTDRHGGNLAAGLNGYGGTPDYAAKIAAAAGGGIPLNIGVGGAPRAVAPIAPNMLGKDQQGEAIDIAAYNKGRTSADPTLFGTPLGDATRALNEQASVLATQRSMYGQSAAAIKGAAEEQQLWNRYVSEGITPTGDLADKIHAYGAQATAIQKQQEDFQSRQQFMSSVGSDVSDVLSAGAIGAATGHGFGGAARSALSGIGQNLIRGGISSITGSIFGGGKSGAGGFLTSLLGDWMPHFAGGTNDAPGGPTIVGENGPEMIRMAPHEQVVSAAALENMRTPAPPTINFGDVHFHASGEGAFSDHQVAILAQQNAQAQQDMLDHVVRNFPQISSDSQQTS